MRDAEDVVITVNCRRVARLVPIVHGRRRWLPPPELVSRLTERGLLDTSV